MLSRSGRASIAPMPRSSVRRGIARLEMIIRRSSLGRTERSARHHSENHRRPPVVARASVARDLPDGGLIVVLDTAPNRVRQKLGAERSDEVFFVVSKIRAKTFDACEPRSVRQ